MFSDRPAYPIELKEYNPATKITVVNVITKDNGFNIFIKILPPKSKEIVNVVVFEIAALHKLECKLQYDS